MNVSSRSSLRFKLSVLCVYVLAFLAYWPGLAGPFLFDDYPNLSMLGAQGGVDDWQTFWSFVLGGFSGPTGRPVSLATFLIDSTVWPADPFRFKLTNLFVHILNATLLYFIAVELFQLSQKAKDAEAMGRIRWMALAAASIWLLHPYLVSTTLYVVQRMAMLSAFFSMAGILSYIYGRKRLANAQARGYPLLLFGVVICTVLAVFSKENGAVLPCLLLVFELIFGKRIIVSDGYFRYFKMVFLILPTVLLCFYLAWVGLRNGLFVDYGNRDFSPYERILSQPRVVFSYLYGWIVPSFSGGNLFYDDFQISKGLLSPSTTILSIIGLILIILTSFFVRRSAPLISFSILVFFSSQIVESTTVGLEIKFDHRAYLGAAFLALPVISFLSSHLSHRNCRVVLFVALSLLFSATLSSSFLWGDYEKLTLVWAQKKPESVRAQIEAAQMQFNAGRKTQALTILANGASRKPQNFRLRLTQALVQCQLGISPREAMRAVNESAQFGPYKHTDFGLLESFFRGANDQGCVEIDIDDFNRVVTKLIAGDPDLGPSSLAYAQLHYYRGLGLLRSGQVTQAKEAFELALQSRSSLHMRMTIAANKANVGLYEEALREARYVRDQLEFGRVKGLDLAEAPKLSDVVDFIRVVENDVTSGSR